MNIILPMRLLFAALLLLAGVQPVALFRKHVADRDTDIVHRLGTAIRQENLRSGIRTILVANRNGAIDLVELLRNERFEIGHPGVLIA